MLQEHKNAYLCSFFASWDIQNEYPRKRILSNAPGTNEWIPLLSLRFLGYSKRISQEEDPFECSRNKRMHTFVHSSPPGVFKTNISEEDPFECSRNTRMNTFVHSSPPGIFKTNIPGGGSFRLLQKQKNEYLCSFFASCDIQNEYPRRRILSTAPTTKE